MNQINREQIKDIADLYDIKVLSQAICDRGFAFTCKTSRQDLAKASVPTLYQDIKNKYDNADNSLVVSSSTPNTNNGVWYNKLNNKYYWSYTSHIYESSNIDLSNPTDLGDKNASTGIIVGKNIIIALSNAYYHTVTIYNRNFDIIKTVDTIKYQTNCFKVLEDRIIFWYSSNNEHYIATISDDENANILQSDNLYTNNVNIRKVSDIYDNCVYLICGNEYAYFKKIDLSSLTIIKDDYDVDTSIGKVLNNSGRLTISPIVIYNDYFYLINAGNVYKSQTMMSGSWTLVTTISTNQCLDIQKLNDNYYVVFNGYIKRTNNFTTFTDVATFTVDTYGYNFFNNFYIDTNNVLLSLKETNIYVYGGSVKTISTDTYLINGNSVAINYYTKDGFKICLANGTNDANLASVYSYLGYYNYYRLDTTNETVSLPRNSNLYSMMYVGDNYQDTTDGISGSATRLLAQSENITITGATPTITISANKTYSFDTAIISLTISDVEVSALESVLYFTTGAGTIQFTAPNTLRWSGGNEQPQLEPNTVYCIAIRNGLAEIDNFGSAS